MTDLIEKFKDKFTKYEIARILGARSLQLAMDAPVLLKIEKEKLEEINYDVLKIAEMELESGVLPITIKRPFPKKTEEKVKKLNKEELKELEKVEVSEEKELVKEEQKEKREKAEDSDVGDKEKEEEKEIQEEGEIMELATPEDEFETEAGGEEEGV